ncbi:hypothetical protein [Bacillus mycoides]|uniref:hypothetical protein n=1 Tax=Bacillus mycoides TaxID=1405 RepID=UPI001F37B662|nr:hypothetical protein [Bacillus mycoides]
MKKIILGFLAIFFIIFMYMSLIGDEDKASLTPNLISKIKKLILSLEVHLEIMIEKQNQYLKN